MNIANCGTESLKSPDRKSSAKLSKVEFILFRKSNIIGFFSGPKEMRKRYNEAFRLVGK